jgi:predicted nucleic acid binding AN1-type Zn finger protein
MCAECSRRCFLMRGAGIGVGLAMGCVGLTGCNNQSRKGASEKVTSEMIAYCGQNCVKCRIYLATRETDLKKQRQMREQIASYITKHFGVETRLEDVTDCDGCTTKDGKLFSECQNCQIRKCAREKGLENCAYCSEYACEKLSKLFDSGSVEAGAKKRLDEIKARL